MRNNRIKIAWSELKLDEDARVELYQRIEKTLATSLSAPQQKTTKMRRRRYLHLGLALAACLLMAISLSWLWPLFHTDETPEERAALPSQSLAQEEERTTQSNEASAEPSAVLQSWQVAPDLEPYQYDPEEALNKDGMGFEGFVYPDRATVLQAEFATGQPEASWPTHLPVFRNLNYAAFEDRNENTLKEKKGVLFQLAKEVAAEYDDPLLSVFYRDASGQWQNYEVDENQELKTLPDPDTYCSDLFAVAEKYNYYLPAKVGFNADIEILFKEPVTLPAGLSFSPYFEGPNEAENNAVNVKNYERNKAQILEAFDYAFKHYGKIFNYQEPVLSYDIENYFYIELPGHDARQFARIYYREPSVCEAAGGDATERFVQRTFNCARFSTGLSWSSEVYYEEILGRDISRWRELDRKGELNLIFGIKKLYFREGLNIETLGDYPLRSVQEAKEALLLGDFRTSYPIPPEKITEEMIVKCELAYLWGMTFVKDFVPYYKFYIEFDDIEGSEFKTYSPCYVPAISPDYLAPPAPEDAPLFNG